MQCQHIGCANEAEFAPALNIPATGYAIDAHQPVKMTTNLRLCATCIEQFTIEDMLNNDTKAMISRSLAATQRVPPDFERAFLTKLRLDSDEFKQFERHAGNRHERGLN